MPSTPIYMQCLMQGSYTALTSIVILPRVKVIFLWWGCQLGWSGSEGRWDSIAVWSSLVFWKHALPLVSHTWAYLLSIHSRVPWVPAFLMTLGSVLTVPSAFHSPQRAHLCFLLLSFLGGSDSKESTCNAGDPGSISGLGRSLGEGNGYLL